MENINILINKTTRMVVLSKVTLGNDGENLQENLVFSFNDEFVNGTARLELTMPDDTNSYIMLTKVGETYQLPIKSVMTQEGKISMQLVITEGTSEEDIPIFKSNVFSLKVRKSINAETISEDEYPDFIDIAETKLNSMDEALEDVSEAINEVENVDLDVSKSGKTATVTLTKKDATTKTITLSDGTSLMFQWDGTRLGIKTDEDLEYTYVDLQGVQGPIGPKGEAFTIKKTYTSVAEMNADFNNMQLGDYVMIASTVEVEDNAKLYTRGESQWIFISDFSGAQGIRGETGLTPNIQIGTVVTGQTSSVTRTGTNENPILNFTLEKGEKGDTGSTGATGETGNGIASIQKTSTSGLVDTYTITYTNGTTSTFEVTNGEDGEVTQAQFDKLEHRVEDLETNQLMDTVSGTTISIDDAHETEIVDGKLSKESTQETTLGTNLIGLDTRKYPVDLKAGDKIVLSNEMTSSSREVWLYTNFDDETKNDYWTVSAGGTKIVTLAYDAKAIRWNTAIPSGEYCWINAGNTALPYETYTGGKSAPSPEFPMDIKTVKGYRNLFDMNTLITPRTSRGIEMSITESLMLKLNGTCNQNNLYFTANDNNKILLKAGTYKFTSNASVNIQLQIRKSISGSTINVNKNTTFTLDEDSYIYNGLIFTVNGTAYNETIWFQLIEDIESKPYVPYGNNYVAVNVSDGTNTNSYVIPLNDNEIAGIGDYKDELIVDSDGHCWLNKKTGKVVLDGSEENLYFINNSSIPFAYPLSDVLLPATNWTTPAILCSHYKSMSWNGGSGDYFVSMNNSEKRLRFKHVGIASLEDYKTWLSTHNTETYYALETPQLIDLNYNVDIRLFKGTNIISNSEDADMEIRYVQDISIIINEIRNGIGGDE